MEKKQHDWEGNGMEEERRRGEWECKGEEVRDMVKTQRWRRKEMTKTIFFGGGGWWEGNGMERRGRRTKEKRNRV